MLTYWLSKLIFLAKPLIRERIIVLIVISIMQQLKFTTFDRFQMAVKYLFHVSK